MNSIDDMNMIIDGNRSSSCNSKVDPKLNPATAAVEKLSFSPEREFERMVLLSDQYEEIGQRAVDNGDQDFYDLQIRGRQNQTGNAFEMASLSQISECISKACGIPARNYTVATPPQYSTNDLKKILSIRSISRDRDAITRKQRRLVRCIACHSRLAQLDSSTSVAVHERGCSSLSQSLGLY